MIVDSHLDIAWNGLARGRGFLTPSPPGYMINRDALTGAGYGLIFATIFTAPRQSHGVLKGEAYAYSTPREAHLLARSQLGYYESAGLRVIRSREELRTYAKHWKRGQLAALLAMENADPIETPRQLGDWVGWGVRMIGPAWSRTRYCGGTNAPGGLTAAGRALLRAMRRRGVILDLSHMADRSLYDSLELWNGPVVATHTGARALCDRQRQLPDDVIAEIGRRQGMLGVSFYSGHLRLKGRAGVRDVVKHIDHMARVAGGPEFIGIGSDLDGGFDAEQAAVDDLGGFREIRSALQGRFGAAGVEGILGGNWLRFLGQALPSGGTS